MFDPLPLVGAAVFEDVVLVEVVLWEEVLDECLVVVGAAGVVLAVEVGLGLEAGGGATEDVSSPHPDPYSALAEASAALEGKHEEGIFEITALACRGWQQVVKRAVLCLPSQSKAMYLMTLSMISCGD